MDRASRTKRYAVATVQCSILFGCDICDVGNFGVSHSVAELLRYGANTLRTDVLKNEVLTKCEVLRKAAFWPSDQRLNPRVWLQNFDEKDQEIAIKILDKFTFYNQSMTDALFVSSFRSIGDGIPKGPRAKASGELVRSLSTAVLTPVRGEYPNPTDSGYLLCRKARQLLEISEDDILQTELALDHAYNGGTIVFVDDIVGSGDQFIAGWKRRDARGRSFEFAHQQTSFTAIYVALLSTAEGRKRIHKTLPSVALCVAHTIDSRATIRGLFCGKMFQEIPAFLEKYAKKLRPNEDYIFNDHSYLMYGYKNRGLMFAFDHSIPDATLPIFWSPGINGWEPLFERR